MGVVNFFSTSTTKRPSMATEGHNRNNWTVVRSSNKKCRIYTYHYAFQDNDKPTPKLAGETESRLAHSGPMTITNSSERTSTSKNLLEAYTL